MPSFFKFPWLRKFFSKGANTDIEPDALPEGVYHDGHNIRIQSVDGNTGSAEVIGGEQVLYPGQDPAYICIGSTSVNGHLVEFWASNDPAKPPQVRIDGVVMAESPNIPYTYDHPLQLATVEQCQNAGVVYPADHNAPPLYWDIQSLIDNYNGNTGAYFGGYTTQQNSVGLLAPPEFPVLRQYNTVVFVGGAQGLSPGQYSYSLRWVTPAGDRTNWGPETGLIPLPQGLELNTQPSSVYPGGRTYGGDPNVLAPTGFGIRFYFRIDNRFGFESVEIKRHRYNDAGGVTSPGVQEIVARIPVSAGQFEVYEYTDPTGSNVLEVVPTDEAQVQYIGINKPKSVEYADNRLSYFNFQTNGQVPELSFRTVNDLAGVPITRKLTRLVNGFDTPDGYDNPFQCAQNKSYQGGERYGFAAEVWNGANGKYFAQGITGLENFRFPSRRDQKAGESLLYSDDPCWGANTDTQGTDPVTETFDSETQGDTAKRNVNSNINVSAPAGEVNRWGPYYNAFGNPGGPPGETNVAVVLGQTFYSPNSNCYKPWDPRDNQADSSGYQIPPNVMRLLGPIGSAGPYSIPFSPPSLAAYTPQVVQGGLQSSGACFAPTYHARGMAVYGVEDLPSDASVLSIVRTDPAGAVVCEGLATYAIGAVDPDGCATKSTNVWWCDFPDLSAGLVPQATIDDIQNNPQNYKLRAVRPMGFYTEVYGYSGESFSAGAGGSRPPCMGARAIDMISYTMTEDHGQVNPGEATIGNMGVQSAVGSAAPPGNYITWSNWRTNNITNGDSNLFPDTYSFWHEGANDGNTPMTISFFAPRTSEARGTTWAVGTDNFLYTPSGNSTATQTAFNNPAVRRFHEPWYLVQIVKDDAQVPQSNSTPYKNTACHIKVQSTIGLYADPALVGDQQDFILVGERWEDCINRFGTDYRYAYVQAPGEPEKRYLCATGNTQINITTILSDIGLNGFWIAPDGLPVYGLYDGVIDDNEDRYLRFGVYGIIPPTGSRLVVKYDSTAPISVFGGDVTNAPNLMGMVDRAGLTRQSIDAGQNNGLPLMGLPTPYAGWMMNPRYFMPEKGTQTEEQIVIDFQVELRQWIVMYSCETRIQPTMLVNAQSVGAPAISSQLFPRIHYVIRPYNEINYGTSAAGNGFFAQYDADYPGEVAIWDSGGIRFNGGLNYDYMKQPPVDFQGVPKSGFTDRTDYCTGAIASDVFAPTQQDTPGLRTFRLDNLVLLSEETGEIKLASSIGTGSFGQNMYVWTQKGYWVIPTNKNILTNAEGDLVATMAIDKYWGTPVAISRTIGMPDELWRLWVKGSMPLRGGGYNDTFIWADRKGFYRSSGGPPQDITRNKYLKVVLPVLQEIQSGFQDQVTAVYDPKYNEYLASVKLEGQPCVVYVNSAQVGEWTGTYSYDFDRYCVHDQTLVGSRDRQSYNLDAGNFINGQRIEAWVEAPVTAQMGMWQEAMRWRVYGDRPEQLELYDRSHVLMVQQNEALQEAFRAGTGVYWVKEYDGWESQVDRTLATYDAQRRIAQDTRFFARVYYRTAKQRVIYLSLQVKHIA